MNKDTISVNLFMAYKKMHLEFQRVAEANGLSGAQYAALQKLWHQDGLTITELGEKLSLKASTITASMDRLERDNLVYRERVKGDRRVVKIFLTEKAFLLKESVPEFNQHLLKKLEKDFSSEEIETLISLLTKMQKVLE